MEPNLSACFRVFQNHVQNVSHSLGIKSRPENDLESYISHRALIIFKLDLLLFEHRNEIDKERFLLFGKNALYHYLFSKKGISLSESKTMSLHDSLIVLSHDLISFKLPTNINNYLKNEFSFNSIDCNLIRDDSRAFQDAEWDPDFSDSRLVNR